MEQEQYIKIEKTELDLSEGDTSLRVNGEKTAANDDLPEIYDHLIGETDIQNRPEFDRIFHTSPHIDYIKEYFMFLLLFFFN